MLLRAFWMMVVNMTLERVERSPSRAYALIRDPGLLPENEPALAGGRASQSVKGFGDGGGWVSGKA